MMYTTQAKTRRFIAIILLACAPLLLLALSGLQLASAAEQQDPSSQVSGVDLSVEKVASAATVVAGRQLTYSLTIRNNGAVRATNVVVSDFMPDGVSLAAWSTSVGRALCDTASVPIVCSMGDLEARSSAHITFVVDVAPDTSGTFVNRAEISSDSGSASAPSQQDIATVVAAPEADLVLTKVASAASAVAGEQLTYTLAITNGGPSQAQSVLVTDTLPVSTSLVSASASVGSCIENGSQLDCDIGRLIDGERAQITVVVAVDAAATGALENRAGASSSVPDPTITNSHPIVSTPIIAVADLSLSKAGQPSAVYPGGQLTYALTIVNDGPSVAAGVLVTDTLPGDILSDTITTNINGATCDASANPIICSLGSLDVGQTAGITITASAKSTASGSLENQAVVGSEAQDPDASFNSDSVTTPVVDLADLRLNKAASAASVVAGQQLTYTLTITNDGPSLASNVRVTDTLPVSTSFSSATPSSGSCGESGGEVVCTLGDLAVDGEAQITVVVNVDQAASGTLENSATAGSDALDANNANNQPSVLTSVTAEADLRLSKAASAASVVAGRQLTYTLTITNDGPSLAAGVRVTDTLPVSTSFSSATPSTGSCGESGGDVVCTLGDLAVDGEAQITLVVNVDQAASGTLENSATAGSDALDGNNANNQPSVLTSVTAEADLRLSKSANASVAVAGGQLTYTLTITNDGPSLATAVRVTDTLPVSTSFSSATPSTGSCGESGGEVVCTLGDLAADAVAQITLMVDVDLNASGTLENSATAGSNTFDSNSANDDALATTPVTTQADLRLSKVASAAVAVAGGQLTYTLAVTNDGPSLATAVRVTDTLPLSTSFSSATPSAGSCGESGGEVVCTLDDLAVDGEAQITLVVNVAAAASGSLQNSATAGSDTFDPNDANNEPSVSTPIGTLADLRLTKTASAASVVAGRQLTYTLTITNDGPSLAAGVRVTDTLPVSTSFSSATPTSGNCGESGGEVVCTLGDLAVDGEAQITLVVNVDQAASGTLENSATAGSDAFDTNTANNQPSVLTPVTAEADLHLSKSANATVAVAGGQLTYMLIITNGGPSLASGVRVTDTLPVSTSFSSATPSTGSCGPSGGDVNCTLGDLAADAVAQITLVVNVDPAASGTLENSATAGSSTFDGNSANDNALVTTPVTAEADLRLSKAASATTAVAGGQLTYTLAITNDGPSLATGVRVTDTLPVSTSFSSAMPSTGSCGESGGQVVCTLGDLAVDGEAQITLVVNVDDAASGSLQNSATAGSDTFDPNDANNEPSVSTPIGTLADLRLTKTASAASVVAGRQLTYTLAITNDGPSLATGVRVTDTLPVSTSFSSATPSTGSCGPSGNDVICTLGDLAVDGEAQITLVVNVDEAASGTLENSATAGSDALDGNSANNQPSVLTSVTAEADLRLSKAASAASVVAGRQLTYTLTITNDGPSLASGVRVTDTLPVSTSFASATPTSGSCGESGGEVVCTLGVLAVDGEAQITLVVNVDAAASGTLENGATAGSDAFDANSANNEPTVFTPVSAEADLRLSKTASVATVDAGGQLTYTLTITNGGPSLATGVRVTDTLPVSTSFSSATPSTGSCGESGGEVVCTLGVLAVDGEAQITLVVDVDPAAGDSLTNTAQVGSAVFDFNEANNEDTIVTSVAKDADLSLNKTASSLSVVAGERLTYTLSATNAGPGTSFGVLVTDTLPGDATLLSWTGTAPGTLCTDNNGEVVCAIGDLLVGSGAVVTLVVEIDSSATGTLVNNALVGSLTDDNAPGNNTATSLTSVVTEVDLSVGKRGEPDPVFAGHILTYTIVVHNNGPSDATNVQMIDTLPVSTTLLSATRQEGPVYIQRIDSYLFTPPSPDTSALAFMETTGRIMAGDSEVEEMTIFEGVNLFDITLDGGLVGTGVTTDYSDEPTGLAYDPLTDRLFVSDDTGIRSVYIVTPGLDGVHGTADDDVTSIGTSAFGSGDPEGVTFDTLDRVLFLLDGLGKRVYRIDPGPGGTFDGVPPAGDDVVTSFDVLSLGIQDPEGIAFNADTGTLFIGGQRQQQVIETTRDGTLLRSIDLPNYGTHVSGLTYAPNSINPNAKSLYASDRGVDNAADPFENDGRITEVALALANAPVLNCGSGQVVTCDLGTLPAGELTVLTLQVQLDARTPISIENFIEVLSDGTEISPGNNTDSEVTNVATAADLSITKTHSIDPVTAGNLLTYTLVISNYGPTNASSIVVTDTLDPDATFVSVDSSQGTGCVPGGIVVCGLGELTPGSDAEITITVQISSAAAITVENIAQVAGQQFDPNTFNNQAVLITGVSQQGSLPLLKLDDPDPVFAGNLLTYTLYVSSTGPSDAFGVVLTDTLPPQVSFITATLSTGVCAHSLGTVVCQLGDMPAGSEATTTIVALVDPNFIGMINNTAIVGASAAVPSQSSQATTVQASADLVATSWASPDPVVAGESLTYTVVISNNGPSLARQVLVNNTLPAGASFKESLNCSPAGAAVICNLGDIAAGATTTATFVVNTDPAATSAQSSSATVFANTSDPNLANNSAVAAAQISAASDLAISKDASTASLFAGQLLTYTLTVSNSGPSNATLVQVSDTLPPGVALQSALSSQGSCSQTNPIVCGLGTLPLNASAVVTVVVQVLPSTGEPIVNSASVTAQPLDPVSENDVAETTTQVNTLADLNVAKVDATDPITAGVNLAYVITVGNAGPSDARDVVLTDTLPAGMTPVSAIPSQGGPCDLAEPLACPLGTVAPGQVVTVNLNVAISPAVTQTLTNTVEVASQTAESNQLDNTASEATGVVTSADLMLDLAAAPDPVLAGELLTYTLTITNNGPSDAAGVAASNQIPPEALLVSASASQGTECDGNSDINCFFGALPVGQSVTVTIVVSLDAGLAPTLLEDTASVSAATADPDPANNSQTNMVTMATATDLSVIKSASPDPVAAGSNLTYTLTITNHGPSNATGVVVTDSLPAATTLVSATSSQGTPCTTGATVTCDLGPIAAGAGAQITIVATVDAAVTGSIQNEAEVSGDQVDPVQSNNLAVHLTSVNQQGSLPLMKLDDPDPVTAGTNLTYTLYISSTGPSDATNVALMDTLPASVSYVTSNFSRGICGYSAGTVTCLLGNMPVGSDAIIEIVVKVDPATSGQINNTAVVTADGAVPSQASQNTTVQGSADLAITNSATPNPVAAGESLTITINVTNNGPSVAKQVIANSTLPAGTTFLQGAGCSKPGASIVCQLGDITVGSVGGATFVVQVKPGTTGQLSSVSSASSATNDPDLSNNSDEATAQVTAVSDLGIHKQSSSGNVVAGGTLTYTLTISNSGPSDAAGVVIGDDLPAGVSVVSAIASQGSGCNAADPIACNLGAVALNGTATVTVVVQVSPSASGNLVNDASVTSSSTDPNGANDNASAPVTVTTLADLNVVKIDGTDPITAGLPLSYHITVGNSGPSDARNVVLTDTLPAGISATSAILSQGGPCNIGPPLTCPLGTITPGQVVTIDLTVNVPPARTEGLLNGVVVSSSTPEANPADNSSEEATAVVTEANLSLGLVDSPDPVLTGDPLVYTLTINNGGPSDATTVVVTTTLAADLQLLDLSPSGACSGSAVVVCEFATLAAGAKQTIVLTATSDAQINLVLVTMATVTADQVDPNMANNSAAESTVYLPKIYRVYVPNIQSGYPSGEPNNTCAQAFRILPNADYEFMPNDVPDWYVLDLTFAGSMTAELTNFTPLVGQMAISKGVDCGNRTSLGNDGTPGPTRAVTLGAQEPGLYYIFVGSDGALSNTNPYHLRVSVVAAP